MCCAIDYLFLATGAGLGVHRTLFKSRSFVFDDSHCCVLPIASARLAEATLVVVLSSNLRAAGVSEPAASAFRGVHDGGGMAFASAADLRIEVGVCDLRPSEPPDPAMSATFALKLLAALADNRWPMTSRLDGALS